MNPELKKPAFYTACAAAFLLISGCATPPPAPPPVVEIPKTQFEEFQTAATARLDAGVLAVIGSAESKNATLAENRALTDGRKRLARMLDGKIDLLLRSVAAETGKPIDDPLFAPLLPIAQAVTKQQIQSLEPARTEQESISGTVRVYCLMELNPQIIIDRIAEKQELYALLTPTQAFALLFRNIKTVEAVTGD